MAFPQKANCVAYWSFDGGNSIDVTGNANTGTDTSVTYSAANGIISNGAAYNGTTGKTAIANSASFSFGTGSFSFSAWIKTSVQGSIWGGRAAGTGPQVGVDGTGKLYSDGVGTAGVTSSVSVATGSFVHIALVWDRGGALLRTYINGTANNTVALGATTATEAITKYIGDEGSPGNLYGKFNGSIDEVGFWNVALSSSDITSLYNGGAGVGYNSGAATTSVSYLVVAGGGQGGGQGGGGGAGGMLTGSSTISSGVSYSVTVGAGGSTGSGQAVGANGANSIFGGITSTGGGGGGSDPTAGQNGGSGGGGADTGLAPISPGTGIVGQGKDGGTGNNSAGHFPVLGGGGGASAVGGNATSSVSGAGGAGSASSISGASVTYAGGGGGGIDSRAGGSAGGGGAGGGGAGGAGGAGSAGTANTGGGGGGSGYNGSVVPTAGAGGSGIVIIAAPTGAITSATGGTKTTSGGNDIWTFTASGTWVPTFSAAAIVRASFLLKMI